MNWLQERLNELGYTHHDLQKALEQQGIKRVRATITGWANGKPVSLFNKPQHAKILAEVLDWTVLEMFKKAGYDVDVPEELIGIIDDYKSTSSHGKTLYLEHFEFATDFINRMVENKTEGSGKGRDA